MSCISRLVLQRAAGRAHPLHSSLIHRLEIGHLFRYSPALLRPERKRNAATTRKWSSGFARSLNPEQDGVTDDAPPRRLFNPSPEQQRVVDLSQTQNVVVSARPGAGKTATAEFIVAANPDRPVAVVTYSKRLQLETASRLEAYPHADVFTFHGMAGRLFSSRVYNDALLHDLRKGAGIPPWGGEPYEIVVLDEYQDCTDDLFWLTNAFLTSVTYTAGGRAPQVVTLGDERQAIYGFRGADSRYLSLSPEILSPLSPYPWTPVALSSSFRLSHQTSAFVNQAFLGGEEYITGSHDGPKPLYVHADPLDVNGVAKLLIPLIEEYGPERTAILAPFVRNNLQISNLTNLLSRMYGVKVAVSIFDDAPLDDLVLYGKLAVSTYHQFKGNERDLVIVYGADNGYFEFLGRHLPDDRCPNETFVALTRARKQLVVMHNAEEAMMPFVSRRAIDETAHLVRLADKKIETCPPIGRPAKMGLMLPKNVFVSDMSRHVSDDALDATCKRYLEITELAAPLPKAQHIDAPDKVLSDPARMHYEAVSDINGMAVVAAYEFELLGTLSTLRYKKSDELWAVPTEERRHAAWLCREACQRQAVLSGYRSRSIQMASHSFNWLGPQLGAAKQRLWEQFEGFDKLDFERALEEKGFAVSDVEADGEVQTTRIRGRADIVQFNETEGGAGPDEEVLIWEIKFVAKLTLEHAVQASTYGYLWAVGHGLVRPPRILLFNIRDGEKWEISAPDGTEGLRCLVEEVLRFKYSTGGEVSTEKFLEMCAGTTEEVEALWESQGFAL